MTAVRPGDQPDDTDPDQPVPYWPAYLPVAATS